MTSAAIGYGAAFGIGDGASPEVFTDLAEVFSITPPSETIDIIDATHMASPSRRREFIPGLVDTGDTSFELNFVPGGSAETALDAEIGKTTTTNFRITFPDGSSGSATWIFAGFVTGFEPSVPNEDKMTATVTIKVTSTITKGTL